MPSLLSVQKGVTYCVAVITTQRRRETSRSTTRRRAEQERGIALGTTAGVLGLGCCVAPTAAALLGITSATAAVDLGNRLYGEWGWTFKGAAVIFAGAALWVQRRRASVCPIDERPDLRRLTLWLGGSGLATYGLLYVGTKALARLA